MKWYSKEIRSLFTILAASLVVIAAALVLGAIDSTAAVAFLGIIIGSIATVTVNFMVARMNKRESLRMTVADERFKAHQEAYGHWAKVTRNIHNQDELIKVLESALNWWNQKCLYLDMEAREALEKCIHDASNYELKKEISRDAVDPDEKAKADEEKNKAWESIHDLGRILAECVALPSVSMEEIPELDPSK